jgi:hypothetical protein
MERFLDTLDSLIENVKKQKEAMDNLCETVQRLERHACCCKKKQKKNLVSLPPFDADGPHFQEVSANVPAFFPINMENIMYAKINGFVKGIASVILQQKTMISLVDRKKKTFYLKLKECWSTDQARNIELFDSLVENLIFHFLYTIHNLEEEDICFTTKMVSTLLAQKKKENFSKSIRYKCLNTLGTI